MRLVLLTILAILPVLAYAMPAAIPAIMVAAGYTATQIAIASLIIMAGSMVYGNAKKRREARRQRAEYNANLSDRTVSIALEDSPHRLVYGRAKVGSSVVAFLTGGDKDQYKYMVCVHASHEIDGYEEIYVGGKALGTLDGNGEVLGGDYYFESTEFGADSFTAFPGSTFTIPHSNVIPSSVTVYSNFGEGDVTIASTYDPDTKVVSISGSTFVSMWVTVTWNYAVGHSRVRVRKHLGTASDPADAMLRSEVPEQWPSTSVLRGHAYTVVRLDLNEPAFQGGPVPVEALIRGKRLYDYRTSTTAWSQNNTLVIYDYLLSEFCGVEADELPMDQFIAAANVCDEPQSFGARYTFNGDVTSDEDQRQVLEKMAQSMAGEVVDTTWDIWAGTYTAPVMDLLQSDIVGKVQINAGASNGAVYNGVKGRYASAETRYVATDFQPYQSATYLAADDEEIWTNIDFPYTDTTQRVHNLARIFVEDQRNGLTVDVEFSLKAWKVKVGQRIRLTAAFWGWNVKVFRVIDKKFGPGAPVKLSLKEDTASIWDFADAVTLDATPNTSLPNPFTILKIDSVTCSSGTNDLLIAQDGTIISRIRVTWPVTQDQKVFGNGVVQAEWKPIAATSWQRAEVRGDQAELFISPVEEARYYNIRARGFNPRLNAYSNWTYAANHQVIGKTENPNPPTALAVTADMVIFVAPSDADKAGFRIRYNAGTNTSLSVAAYLHDKQTLVPGSPWPMPIRLYGINTVLVTTVDTSGNESIAAYDTQDFGVPDEANVADLVEYSAIGFPGVITNGAVSGTDLEAGIDPAADIYGAGSGADIYYRDGAADIYGGDQYLALSYLFTYASPYSGGTILLDYNVIGSRVTTDYRIDGAAIGDVYSGTDIYGGTSGVYGDEQQWRPWTGAMNPTVADLGVQFRIITDAGSTQGVIDSVSARTEMPSLEQTFGRVTISAAGTILSPSAGIPPRDWIAIEDVQITPIADGSGAISGRVKGTPDPSIGPEAELINQLAGAVTGDAYVRVRGY